MNSVNKNPSVSPNALVKELIERKTFETVATKHGIAMETHAKEKLKNILNKTHMKCQFHESGMIINKELPYLSASPDMEGLANAVENLLLKSSVPTLFVRPHPLLKI